MGNFQCQASDNLYSDIHGHEKVWSDTDAAAAEAAASASAAASGDTAARAIV